MFVDGNVGVVQHLGTTEFSAGTWVGVVFDEVCRESLAFSLHAMHNFPQPATVRRVRRPSNDHNGSSAIFELLPDPQVARCAVQPLGKNDGTVAKKRYFTCAPRHGLFVRPNRATWWAA